VTIVNELLRNHVTLTVDCLDRIYLNGYVPTLQMGGQLVNFLTRHLGNRIPSPALVGKTGEQYRNDVKAYATKKLNKHSIQLRRPPSRRRLSRIGNSVS
jgi:hypothetical protein